MHFQWNAKNLFKFLLVVSFGYLGYVIFLSNNDPLPEIEVELRDIINYAVLAVEMGGHAVARVHKDKTLMTHEKGLTDEGKAELLTTADLVSNFLILDVLKRFMGLKIVTEEKDSGLKEEEVYIYREDRYSLWTSIREGIERLPSRRLKLSDLQVYVDPVDATQELTENLTQYVTVMICIAEKDEPIFGAIYRPFHNETIFGVANWGAMKSTGEKLHHANPATTPKIILVSRSHSGSVKEIAKKAFGDQFKVESAGGTGYKTLRLVNGSAELYIHSTAIKKWDTCAGDAIIRSMGGMMLDFQGEPLRYGASEPTLHKGGLLVAARTPFAYYKHLKKHLPTS